MEKLKEAGARRVLPLNVGGAFHSPLMAPAGEKLKEAIENTDFHFPIVPIYQNVTAEPTMDPSEIKENLIKQLTSPVRWTQTVQNILRDNATEFIEVGPGKVLQGLVKKVNRKVPTRSAM
jgi:[acyl-carrier-protein] S-malonyltransferase